MALWLLSFWSLDHLFKALTWLGQAHPHSSRGNYKQYAKQGPGILKAVSKFCLPQSPSYKVPLAQKISRVNEGLKSTENFFRKEQPSGSHIGGQPPALWSCCWFRKAKPGARLARWNLSTLRTLLRSGDVILRNQYPVPHLPRKAVGYWAWRDL